MSKTDVKQTWLNKPKSRPKVTKTITEMFPGADENYRYRSVFIAITSKRSVMSFQKSK